jgi:flagellar hook-associated protein 2
MATYQAGGLASGIDTLSIIDQFVALQKRPVTKLQQRQSLVNTQISKLGEVANRIASLQKVAEELGKNGVRVTSVSKQPTSMTVTSTGSALPGRYSVEVTSLATGAKARSQAFASANAAVTGGTFSLSIKGQNYDVTIADGSALTDVARQINALGAPVSASLVTTNGQTYLSLATRDTGYEVGQPASSALSFTETSTGSLGQALGATVIQAATNAHVTVDGLDIERSSNVIDDAIPGVTMNLTGTGSAEELILASDAAASQARVQAFVNAIKDVKSYVDAVASNAPGSEGPLAGDSTMRAVRRSLDSLTQKVVPGLTSISTLGAIGVGHDKTGILQFDTAKFATALREQPSQVDSLFTQATTGISAVVKTISDRMTAPATGEISTRKQGLQKQATDYGKRIEKLNASIENYRKNLERQFMAMEDAMSKYKTISSYLTQQAAANKANKD